MTADELAKALTDAALEVLHNRKGFDWWWWGDAMESAARASIKREMRGKLKAVLKRNAPPPPTP